MAKKTARKAQKRTTPARKARAAARKPARKRAAAQRGATARKTAGRRGAGPKAVRRKRARKVSTVSRKRSAGARKARKAAPKARGTARKAARTGKPRRGVARGMERTLAQTPETGRTVRGRTNPWPTRRSTGTAAGAGNTRHAPGLERARRQLREIEEHVPTPPSSLDFDREASAARTGRAEMREALQEHTETSPVLTGGDVDADWEDAYSVGDEAPGGDNPTPDQDRVDDIGRALGVQYQDNEELRSSDKIADRDRHRWELDPASSEDYRDRDKEE